MNLTQLHALAPQLAIIAIGWSPGVRGMALALADALTSEADEINADELSGLDALAARDVLRPL